jgi:predicted enzyme related to lactoylglutathione lyase
MKRTALSAIVILALSVMVCNNKSESVSEKQNADSAVIKNTNDMKSFVSIFEIPATDISRAVDFYQEILDINIEKMEMPEMHMGIFPYEGQMVTGVIVKGEGHQPSADGVTIYLNGGDNLQVILDKVENKGGKIVAPKTSHADESGYFALFLDTEGNRIGLHSPN